MSTARAKFQSLARKQVSLLRGQALPANVAELVRSLQYAHPALAHHNPHKCRRILARDARMPPLRASIVGRVHALAKSSVAAALARIDSAAAEAAAAEAKAEAALHSASRQAKFDGAQMEGDLSLYTPAQVLARGRLRRQPRIEELLQCWWHASAAHDNADGDDVLDKAEYEALYTRLLAAFDEDGDDANDLADEAARAAFEEDWVKDSGGDGAIDEEEFKDAIFELADHWCEGVDAIEYIEYLEMMYNRVFRDLIVCHQRAAGVYSAAVVDAIACAHERRRFLALTKGEREAWLRGRHEDGGGEAEAAVAGGSTARATAAAKLSAAAAAVARGGGAVDAMRYPGNRGVPTAAAAKAAVAAAAAAVAAVAAAAAAEAAAAEAAARAAEAAEAEAAAARHGASEAVGRWDKIRRALPMGKEATQQGSDGALGERGRVFTVYSAGGMGVTTVTQQGASFDMQPRGRQVEAILLVTKEGAAVSIQRMARGRSARGASRQRRKPPQVGGPAPPPPPQELVDGVCSALPTPHAFTLPALAPRHAQQQQQQQQQKWEAPKREAPRNGTCELAKQQPPARKARQRCSKQKHASTKIAPPVAASRVQRDLDARQDVPKLPRLPRFPVELEPVAAAATSALVQSVRRTERRARRREAHYLQHYFDGPLWGGASWNRPAFQFEAEMPVTTYLVLPKLPGPVWRRR